MIWTAENCDGCRRSIQCRKGKEVAGWDDNQYREAVLGGLECGAKYAIDYGWITSVIDQSVSLWMGGTENSIPANCIHFTDDKNDDPENRPDPIDPRQLKIPFMCVELFGFDDPNILVFDKAIIEREVFA